MASPSAQPIRVLLVDDHELVRSGLRLLIETNPHITVVGEATTRDEMIERATLVQPDIVVLDLDLHGESSLNLIPRLREVAKGSHILVLTGLGEPSAHYEAIRMGALGLVEKRQAATVLIKAIERVAAGLAWLDPNLATMLVSGLAQTNNNAQVDPEAAKITTLTDREHEVIALICKGLQNRAIGAQLSISETTVRHHLTSIFAKLGVETRLELVIYAYRNGLARL